MVIILEMPKEFNDHFSRDRFTDSLARIYEETKSAGYSSLCGLYERELLSMLIVSFQKAHIISSGDGIVGV